MDLRKYSSGKFLEELSIKINLLKLVIKDLFLCLTLCMLGNFSFFLWSADFFLSKFIAFSKNSFRNTIRVSNCLGWT